MNREMLKNTGLDPLIPLAHPFSMGEFLEKVYSLLESSPDADQDEKHMWQLALVWGAWKGQQGAFAAAHFPECLDTGWQEVYSLLSEVVPYGREELLADETLREVAGFDEMIEKEMKANLPALPPKQLAEELEGAPRFCMYLYALLNVGDDLFAHILFRRYPEIVFGMPVSPSYSQCFKDFPNVIPVSFGENVWAAGYPVDLDYDSFDGYISIGGSVFPDWIIYKYYLDRTVSGNFFDRGKKVFYVGSNADRNYTNPLWNIDTYNEFFSKHRDQADICLRDEYSYKLFEPSGCARQEPDIVFGLVNEYAGKEEMKDRRGLGISIIETRTRSDLSRHHDMYMSGLVSVIREAFRREIPVTVFSFCKFEGDEDAADELISMLSEEERAKVNCVLYNGDLDGFLRTYSSMKYIVSTRFHATILALKFRQKVFPVIYGDKIQSLLADLGGFGPDSSYDLRTDASWDANQVWSSLEEERNLEEKLTEWEEAARRQFLKLDEYIKGLRP